MQINVFSNIENSRYFFLALLIRSIETAVLLAAINTIFFYFMSIDRGWWPLNLLITVGYYSAFAIIYTLTAYVIFKIRKIIPVLKYLIIYLNILFITTILVITKGYSIKFEFLFIISWILSVVYFILHKGIKIESMSKENTGVSI